jgi:hypothetical protein
MSDDLKERLVRVAARPARELDIVALHRRGVKRRRLRQAAYAMTTLSALAVLGLGAQMLILPRQDTVQFLQPPPEDQTGTSGIVHSGALPDGRLFEVHGSNRREQVTGIRAVIEANVGGTWLPLGVTTFERSPSDGASAGWKRNVLRVPAGEWRVDVAVDKDVLDELGPRARRRIEDGIAASSSGGLPVLRLQRPLRFADDADVPSSMEVMYETFTVRRGCSNVEGTDCSDDGCVHVVPLAALVAPPPETPHVQLTVLGHCQ